MFQSNYLYDTIKYCISKFILLQSDVGDTEFKTLASLRASEQSRYSLLISIQFHYCDKQQQLWLVNGYSRTTANTYSTMAHSTIQCLVNTA